ncbi:unnamed protein product [Ectocarpus sp. 6 AP-2014]
MHTFRLRADPAIAVDVALLAIVVALHMTHKDENLKLFLIVLIVVHVAATTRRGCTPSKAPQQLGGVNNVQTETSGSRTNATGVSVDASDAGYIRQLKPPANSNSRNLVESRTQFYKDIHQSHPAFRGR